MDLGECCHLQGERDDDTVKTAQAAGQAEAEPALSVVARGSPQHVDPGRQLGPAQS